MPLAAETEFIRILLVSLCILLLYDVAAESVIKPFIKNGNPLVDLICKLRR